MTEARGRDGCLSPVVVDANFNLKYDWTEALENIKHVPYNSTMSEVMLPWLGFLCTVGADTSH